MNRVLAMHGLATVAAVGLASVASAQTAPGMGDLIGVRGSSVESELQSRGYEFATNMGSAALWWNARTKTCVSVAVNEGRVQSIQTASAGDCGKSTSSSHAGSSGHASHVQLSDLNGMDAVHAFDVMTERGFTNVDTISAGDEIYSTYWNPSTRQCVQMNSRNGRVFGIEKVPSHPKCR